MRQFNRKAVEKVLTDCGWKIDRFMSTCFGGVTYGADGKYPRGAVFLHPIHDKIYIMVKGEVDPAESRTKNRWEIIGGCNYRGQRVLANALAWGTSPETLALILTPEIAIDKPKRRRRKQC